MGKALCTISWLHFFPLAIIQNSQVSLIFYFLHVSEESAWLNAILKNGLSLFFKVCVRVHAHGSKKKVLDPWELELGGCEPLNMGAENWTPVLCKNIRSS